MVGAIIIWAMTYDEIVAGLRGCLREIETEGRLVSAGLKEEQQTAEIVERYAWLYTDDALSSAAQAERDASGPTELEAARRVRVAVMQGMISRRTAPANDRLATRYMTSKVRLPDGEEMPFFTAQSMLARESNAERRQQLGEACGAVMVEADGIALEVAATTMDVIKGFGYDSYIRFCEDVSGTDYRKLQVEVARVAAACHDRYERWASKRMEAAGSRFGECSRWHVFYFRKSPAYDSIFTREAFEPAMRRTFSSLGLDLFSMNTIHLDLADRPAKSPRASVSVPEAGVEVHLLTRPLGGNLDYAAFMHEGGHALHYGLTDASIGWPLANLGRSWAYAELWSYLIERIGFEPAWLHEVMGVDEPLAQEIAADLAGIDLMMFMRYCAKLAYELELFAGDPLDRKRGGALYSRSLSQGTGFRYGPEGWQFDRDSGFYSADYLRAWLAEAALRQRLVDMFGARWWAGKEAGRWLREQWLKGSLPEPEGTVVEVGGKPWSGDALIGGMRARL